MTALAQDKARRQEAWRFKSFLLAIGAKAYKGGACMLNLGLTTVQPASLAPAIQNGQLPIGNFAEQVDNTLGATTVPVQVDFGKEMIGERFANDGTNPCVQATDIGAIAYFIDDQTVSISPGANRAAAGRIWDVDVTRGVLIEKMELPLLPLDPVPTATTPAVYTANVLTLTQVSNGAVYDVPTQAAASTIVLPATAPDGTSCTFCADGTKNGFTTTYQDATGAVALTAAFVASKRHCVFCVKRGGKWFATGNSSP